MIRYETGNAITRVRESIAQIPVDYNLSIYPNPFNPQTTISFRAPKNEQVRIEVYSTLGQLVDVLMDDFLLIGEHSVSFQPAVFSATGIYIVRISTESRIINKKVTFLK